MALDCSLHRFRRIATHLMHQHSTGRQCIKHSFTAQRAHQAWHHVHRYVANVYLEAAVPQPFSHASVALKDRNQPSSPVVAVYVDDW